jgi:hypothetical protein
VDDLLDQLERMLRARTETDERNIRLFARSYWSDLADFDLRRDHLVSEAGDHCCDIGQAVLALVSDEHTEMVHFVTPQALGINAKRQYRGDSVTAERCF